ncbi:MAG TPA: hypothetical protein VMQ61_15430 [Thermoanaerobaculia bacterium]|nr:hypothetical protein [Thermoanaerobaculia bacterium]
MKRTFLLAAGLLAAASFVAAQETQTTTSTETTVKHSGPGPDTKAKMETVVGTVKEYEAGKKIKIAGPKDKTYSFDLDENARVEGAVVVGQQAKVEYWKGTDGHERVSVVSEASRSATMAATMPKSHTESTTKNEHVNAPDTKSKTESVVGVVKKYEAGKKIVVTGPNNKDYSFDLDENAAVSGTIAVGERVKVTRRKGESGESITAIARYSGKA